MRKLLFCFLIIVLASCEKTQEEPFVRKYTVLQSEYLKSASLTVRVSIQTCMDSEYNSWGHCQREALKLGQPCVTQTGSGGIGGIGETAVGTALGYGAAKIILGR